MRVYVVRHERSDNAVYCPLREQALDTLARCIRKQENRPAARRESVRVSVEKISKAEWDAMEDIDDNEC